MLAAATAIACLPPSLLSQATVRGRVLALPGDRALAGATVSSIGTRRSTLTGADGAFVIEALGHGDTLRVTAIGFAPNLSIVQDTATMVIRMVRGAVTVEELRVTEEFPRQDRLGISGRSVLGDSTARVLPLSLEPDVFRTLSVLPGVAFNSVLSARPILQGGDADDTGFAIDGHQVMNPFHSGRFFAAFPAIATSETVVELLPAATDIGHTASGRVNIRGKEWHAERPSEIQYGLGAWSGLTGTSNSLGNFTFGGRTIRGSIAGVVAARSEAEFNLYDLYGRATVANGNATITAYRAHNRASEALEAGQPPPAFIDAGHSLLGLDTRLWDNGDSRLRLTASHSAHTQRSTETSARSTSVEVNTRLARTGASLTFEGAMGATAMFEVGAGLFRREIRNGITPLNPVVLPAAATEIAELESESYAALRLRLGGLVLTPAVRVDAFHGEVAVQPRLTVRMPLAGTRWIELSGGRASRLIHLVSDDETISEAAIYDYWLVAGQPDVPVATADHLAVEFGNQFGATSFRARMFGSVGTGRVDLDRDHQSRDVQVGFRVGRTRTIGAEVAMIWRSGSGTRELQAAYTWMRSGREWEAGWIPAHANRQHRFRLNGASGLGSGLVLAGTFEAGSGVPFTPALQWYPNRVFGTENSRRGAWGARVDAALTYDFGGPWGTIMTLGASVTNLSLGDQVIRESELETNPDGSLTGRLLDKPVFWLPPFPSVIVRVKW